MHVAFEVAGQDERRVEFGGANLALKSAVVCLVLVQQGAARKHDVALVANADGRLRAVQQDALPRLGLVFGDHVEDCGAVGRGRGRDRLQV